MKQSNNPAHVAIILDGNRRFARKKGLMPWQGHRFGVKKVEDIINWCNELGVKELTLYSFSLDNFKRHSREKKILFSLFKSNIKKLDSDERLNKNKIRVRFIGRINMFPKDLQKNMHSLMNKTKKNKKFKLNFAMAYSGKAEITDSLKHIIKKIKNKKINEKNITEKLINENLYLSSAPDILIRPGGEKRISDFLLWQICYSEIFFIDKLWPEFTKEDLMECVEEFKRRERRFGK